MPDFGNPFEVLAEKRKLTKSEFKASEGAGSGRRKVLCRRRRGS